MMLPPSRCSRAFSAEAKCVDIDRPIYPSIDRSDTESESHLSDCGSEGARARSQAGLHTSGATFYRYSARLSILVHEMKWGILHRRGSVIFDVAFRVGLMTVGASTKH